MEPSEISPDTDQPPKQFPGAELAQLLLGSFHSMVNEVLIGLAKNGHPGVRASHEFVLQSILAGADTASELGLRLAVSKQAAAKKIEGLQQLGYVEREVDPDDARRKRVKVTARGYEMMMLGGALFNEVRNRWAAQIGLQQLETLEAYLSQLTAHRSLNAESLADFEEILDEEI